MGNPNAPYRPGEWLTLRDYEMAGALIGGFGAIAYSPATRRYGWSYNVQGQANAEETAMCNCGASDAIILVWGHHTYLALALAENGGYGAGWDTKPERAKQQALAACPGTACQIVLFLHTRRGVIIQPRSVPP